VTIAEFLVLARASALWPTLVAVVLVVLNLGNPRWLLLAFLVGGLATTITVGLVIVFSLEGHEDRHELEVADQPGGRLHRRRPLPAGCLRRPQERARLATPA
jgi:hypothetical protein